MNNSLITYFFGFLTVGLLLLACNNSPDYSDVPTIEFVSISNFDMVQNPLNSDTSVISFSFTDGDGDIGFEDGNINSNIFIVDNRTGDFFDRFRLPAIPPQGANNGVSGQINMVILNTCCVFPPQDSIPPCESPSQFPTNDLTFTIYMIDRAGNKSNEISTPSITLRCN